MSRMYAELRPKSRDERDGRTGGDSRQKPRLAVTGQAELLKYIEALERKEQRAVPRKQEAGALPRSAGGEADDESGAGWSISEAVAATERALLERVRALREKASAAEAQSQVLTQELATREKESRAETAAHARRVSELEAACGQALARAEEARAALGRREQELRDEAAAQEGRLSAAEEQIARLRRETAAAEARATESAAAAGNEREHCRALSSEIAALKTMCAARLEQIGRLRAARAKQDECWEEIDGSLGEIERSLAESDAAPEHARIWRLRLGDGAVYGPASIADLRRWAADCRIGPDHEVSDETGNWRPAYRLDGLGMTWTVPLVNGRAWGPLHISAASALLADGVVAPDGEASDAATGIRCRGRDLAGLELKALREEIERLAETTAAGNGTAAELNSRVRRMKGIVERVRRLEEASAAKPETADRQAPPVRRPALRSTSSLP